MGRIEVGNALAPAWEHMMRVLFRPFALSKWLALGFAGMMAAYGQGASFNYNSFNPQSRHGPHDRFDYIAADVLRWITHHVGLVVALVLLLVAIGIFFSWLASVFKFVYLNQLTCDPRAIREPFARFTDLGTSFFLWELALGAVVTVVASLLIALPLLLAFAGPHVGWGGKALAIAWALLAGLVIVVPSALAAVFARDFVAPVMFLRGIRVIEAWKVVLPILKANAGQLVIYVLLLLAIALAAGIYGIFAVLAAMLALAIPAGILAALGYGIYAACGHSFTPLLWGYAGLMGTALGLAIAYAISCAMQPAMVFRRSFALVVLGQADASLASIPVTRTPPPPPPYWQQPGPER